MSHLSTASPACVAENFDGEIVALNLDTGLYFSLPGLPGAIWRDLNAGHPAETILADLTAVNPVVGRDARALIDTLVFYGLLRATDEPVRAPPEPEYRALVAGGDIDLTFTVHDDMKDLVMTDPIHDVDEEAGWPVLRGDGG